MKDGTNQPWESLVVGREGERNHDENDDDDYEEDYKNYFYSKGGKERSEEAEEKDEFGRWVNHVVVGGGYFAGASREGGDVDDGVGGGGGSGENGRVGDVASAGDVSGAFSCHRQLLSRISRQFNADKFLDKLLKREIRGRGGGEVGYIRDSLESKRCEVACPGRRREEGSNGYFVAEEKDNKKNENTLFF